MAKFDEDKFWNSFGQTGGDLLASTGASYGIPSCMLNLGKEVLSLIPTPILATIELATLKAQQDAQAFIKKLFRNVTLKYGIIEFDTETGTIRFKSNSSLGGITGTALDALNAISQFLAAIQYAASFGAEIYSNYESAVNQIQGIKDCFDKFETINKFTTGPPSNSTSVIPSDEQFAAAVQKSLEGAVSTLDSIQDFQNRVTEVLAERAANPDLEPKFINSSELKKILGDSFLFEDAKDPGLDDTFRLSYGPPESNQGHFIFSIDGLYYDSQSGGLDPIYVAINKTIDPGDVWKYNFDPNLGGKGSSISLKELNKFTDNIFDIENIDDSVEIKDYYDADHFLNVLLQQKSKIASDLQFKLQSYISEYGEDSALVKNLRQSIISEISAQDYKVNKRKKQIEIAIKAPQIYGNSALLFKKGEIPINDFSYLQDLNLSIDLEKQKNLTFNQGDVTGVVLPIKPKFVKSSKKPESLNFNYLNIPTVGKGQIIYSGSGTQDGNVLSLTDEIETNNLFAIYNFLETKTVLPSSTDFFTTNCAVKTNYNNAQLVATNPERLFFSGLGIPYFRGIVENSTVSKTDASSLGSFLKLPDTKEFRDFTYNSKGFSIDFWVHVPDITDGEVGWLSGTTSSLTKVILGCENVGAKANKQQINYSNGELLDLDYLINDKSDSFVRGFLMGFTRDRRITQENTGYSNDNYDNDPVSSLSFFAAPTISRDSSSASWINSDSCLNGTNYLKFKVDLSDTSIGNVSSQFVHLNFSVDPKENSVVLYCDGEKLATSSISEVFGELDFGTVNLPTFKKENSFQYEADKVEGPETVKNGPNLNPFFTPWIVGGGYTDGYKDGNFMGGDRSGIISGLRGFLGSLKFYSKPLDTEEVIKNYKAQKGFFKNIKT